MNYKMTALVPMKHISERVPGKNYRLFDGKPLFHHIINTLSACKAINEIIVDTDSSIIVRELKTYFPEVKIIDRPEHLRSGMVPMNDVLLHDINFSNADFFIQTHSTSPLLKEKTISNAINQFINNYPQHDSLFSVTRIQARLWDSEIRPINHNPAILRRTQDLPPVFEENSGFFIFSPETLRNGNNRIGNTPLIFEISRDEAWDIDDETDFKIAEILFKEKRSNQ